MQYFDFVRQRHSTWQSAGKGLKLHGRVWGSGGTYFAAVLKPFLNAVFRLGTAEAFDLAKRWQGAKKLYGRVWGPGGTCFAAVLKPSKCSISIW